MKRFIAFIVITIFCIHFHAFSQSLENLNDSIQKYRKGIIVVKTTPNTKVELEQLQHEFWFGAALANHIFDGRASDADVEQYKELFLQNFNSAVTENALKWGNMEPDKGKVDFAIVDNMLRWTEGNNIPLRGHNIYWGIDKFVQPWVKELDDEQLYLELKKRGRMIGARYKGRFAEYDLNNEMIHGDYYQDRLGPGITKKMSDWVKECDPDAKLYLNDYDILTGNSLEEFVEHIKDLKNRGVSFDGIGVQGHLHAESFDPQALQHALNVLAQFDLPIRITEFNMPGQRSKFYKDRSLKPTAAEEQQMADDLVDYYRICFANPAVDGILMWGFWADANWIPASSLYREDWSPTALANAYQKLIFDEWWTRFEGTSDENGMIIIPAFYGTHQVKSNGKVTQVNLQKKDKVTYIELK
jgi:GH35 family endo-1,4-beta-xylanase